MSCLFAIFIIFKLYITYNYYHPTIPNLYQLRSNQQNYNQNKIILDIEPIMKKQQTEEPNSSFFLFVNPGSGGNLGKQMLDDQVEKYQFMIPIENYDDVRRIDVYMYNLRENRDRGLRKLKQLNDQKKRAVAVVCGGDGTIMWVLSEFQKYKINPAYTPIAIIPLGTGNDFSRSLGWGGSPFLKWSTKQLKQIVRNWMEAEQAEFDLWDVTANVYENGCFEKVSQQKDVELPQKVIKKTFCNYFSLGIDGQIGYSFDKLRTTSKLANFAVYGAVGAFNDLLQPITVNELIEAIYQTPVPEDEEHYKQQGRAIFKTDHKQIHLYGNFNGYEATIKEGQRNILSLNIDSYTGGTTGIWKNAKQVLTGQQSQLPSYSDGLIQVVCFDSGLGIAMEKSIGGFAKKIVQSKGPLRYDFRRVHENSHCTYLQIDGQFLRFNHPKSVIVKKSTLLGGKIRVLRRDLKKQVFNPFKDLQELFS